MNFLSVYVSNSTEVGIHFSLSSAVSSCKIFFLKLASRILTRVMGLSSKKNKIWTVLKLALRSFQVVMMTNDER